MQRLGTTAPDSDPGIQRLIIEARARLARAVGDRELTVELVAAAAFLSAAICMAALVDAPGALDWPLALGLVAVYAVATRVEFRLGTGWTDPSTLAFVPMLLLLPTQLVPLFVMAAMLIARFPEYANGDVHPARAILRIADAGYAIWPAAVLLALGATSPDWADWPVYLLALVAWFACDAVTSIARIRLGLGVRPGAYASELVAVYGADAMLAPLGLLGAFAGATEPGAVFLVLPLVGLLVVFAREREARIASAEALGSAYRGTAHLMSELLSDSDEYTGEHSRSVTVMAHRVGEKLGLDEKILRDIEFGALLHDVGKIHVPNELLNKPGKLTDEEFDVVRKHTTAGEEMLSKIGGVLGDVGIVVRSHHERYDGRGYPDGLEGEEIPIAARVITVCDSFNAMTTDRSYRTAMSHETAVEELRRESGHQFDPRVVNALIEVLRAPDSERDRIYA